RMQCMFQYAELRKYVMGYIYVLPAKKIFQVSFHTFLLIRQARNLSVKTKSFHRMLMFSLIAVAAVPMTLIVAPFSSAMVYYLFLFYPIDAEIPVMDIAHLLIAFHSVVHSLVLILTTPVFRKRLKQIVKA
ncbi:hypothetical protein PMAYCL1PPCAC_19543, partial [Pristionchus mayeri]